MRSWTIWTALAAAVAVTSLAAADIVTVSGDVVHQTSIPSNLGLHQYESNDDLFVFDEQQGVTLTTALTVDILGVTSGTYTVDGTGDPPGGSISAGTMVNSYVIHIDPVGSATSPLYAYSGSITFSNPILGVIVTDARLDGTDSSLGNAPGTTYFTGDLRGLELNGQDWFTLSANTLTLNLKAANVLDNIRVIEAVPTPAAVLIGMLGLGVAGLRLRKFV